MAVSPLASGAVGGAVRVVVERVPGWCSLAIGETVILPTNPNHPC